MTKREQLYDQLEALEERYQTLVIAELESCIAGGQAPYLGAKLHPGYSDGEGRTNWTDTAEELVKLELRISASRRSLGESLADSPVYLIDAYIVDLRGTSGAVLDAVKAKALRDQLG